MAGALMTGTHGGSAHHQSTASMIRGCRMVLADGSIKDIGEVCNAETSLVHMSPPPHALTYTRQDDELLDWVFPSLGMLGIVTRMTLKMVPSYKLRAICTVMSLAELQARACPRPLFARYIAPTPPSPFHFPTKPTVTKPACPCRVAGRDL